MIQSPMSPNLLNNLKRSVVIAMVAMRMMEAAIDQVVHMIAMRNGRVSAIRPMNMLCRAFRGGESRRAFIGIGRINSNCMFIHVILVWMMKMAIVNIIYMPFMLNRDVPAAGGVDVSMVRVGCTGIFGHNLFRSLSLSLHTFQNNKPVPSRPRQEMFLQVTCI